VDKHELVDRYFANIRNKDLDSLIAFFAPSATMTLPDGRELAGVVAIRTMYSSLFAAQSPSPRPITVIAGEHGVAAEIEATLPNGTVRRTANFFHLESDGKIKRLSIYARGG
jgi:ketosteroid isomerase-like protein